MELAKPHLDLGVYVSDIDASRAFYEGSIGLPYEELLKVGGGVHQHRLSLRGAVLKLNASRQPVPTALPSCLRAVMIATPDLDGTIELVDPDGLPVTLVPVGHERVETVGVTWATRDAARMGALLESGLGARPVEDRAWRVGTTLLRLVDDADAEHGELRAAGLRYLTVQVRDVHAEHARLLSLGWREGAPPVRLGDVAAISFVCSPEGVWVEVSQRASLTGALPDAP